MAENPAHQYANKVAREIADPKGRVDPCQLKAELERRPRPKAPSPHLEPVMVALWTELMDDKVLPGCKLAHPGQPDEGLHWLIQNGELILDPDHLHPLSETLPDELENNCNTLLKEWCPKIRSQPLLRQYRILEAAVSLSRTPDAEQPEALKEFTQRWVEGFPDGPPPPELVA